MDNMQSRKRLGMAITEWQDGRFDKAQESLAGMSYKITEVPDYIYWKMYSAFCEHHLDSHIKGRQLITELLDECVQFDAGKQWQQLILEETLAGLDDPEWAAYVLVHYGNLLDNGRGNVLKQYLFVKCEMTYDPQIVLIALLNGWKFRKIDEELLFYLHDHHADLRTSLITELNKCMKLNDEEQEAYQYLLKKLKARNEGE